jgi:hypothetical protein
MKVEILNVEGTTVTVRLTMNIEGTENSETLTLDIAHTVGTVGDEWAGHIVPGLDTTLDTLLGFGFLIPANSPARSGVDIIRVQLDPYTVIGSSDAGENTRTCVGVSRTVVHATWSHIGGRYGTSPFEYYWDKQTGVMVEASATLDGMTATAKATETNMWQATPSGLPIEPVYLYILAALAIIVAVGAVAFIVRRRKKTPEEAS